MLGKISFSISIDTQAHAAFGDTPDDAIQEIVRSVRDLIRRVENTDSEGNSDLNCSFCIKDINGNTIGTSYLDIEYDDPEEANDDEEEEEEESLDKTAQLILKRDGDCYDVHDCTYCPMSNEPCWDINRVEFLNSKGYFLLK